MRCPTAGPNGLACVREEGHLGMCGAVIDDLFYPFAHPTNRPQLDPSKFKGPLRLDVGAGPYPRGEEYTTVDAYYPAHVRAVMWDIPFPDGSVHSIWSSHALEHAAGYQVPLTLKEWFRLLRPGGKLIVQVPNFYYVATYWLTGPVRDWAEQLVFGQQKTPGDFHRSAHTPQSLEADLKAAGFEVKRVEFRQTHSQETLQAVAIKPWKPKDV